MATWQFSFHVIPRSEAHRLLSVGRSERRRVFEDFEWWAAAPPSLSLIDELDGFMRETADWSSDLRSWGKDDGDRIELWFDRDRIVEIFGRIDLRQVDLDFLAGALRLAELCGGMILTENMEICDPTLDGLTVAMLRSPAPRFVADPGAFWHARSGHRPEVGTSMSGVSRGRGGLR